MSLPAAQRAEDEGMVRVYTLVLVWHAVVITALWLFGRTFSS
jgi:hypothetical protein